MNGYQLRGWKGWYHHEALVIAAQALLSLCQKRLRSHMPGITIPQVRTLLQPHLSKKPVTVSTVMSIVKHWQERIAAGKEWHAAARQRQLAALGLSVA